MAASSLEKVWQLMSENTFETENDLTTEKLWCGICKKLIVDAYQSQCGCRYCHKCVHNHTINKDKLCEGNSSDCNEECLVLNKNVFRNSLLDKKILKLKVRCPHQSCECCIELERMEEHLRICTKQPSSCPYVQIGCDNEETSREAIMTHLQTDTFVHSELLIELCNNLKNEVSGLKIDSDLYKSEIMGLKEESRIKDRQLTEMVIRIEEWKREIMVQIEEKNSEVVGQMKKLNEELENRVQTLEKDLRGFTKAPVLFTVDNESTERETRSKIDRGSIDGVSKDMEEEILKSKKTRRKRMNNLIMFCLKINADFVWRIEECEKKIETTRRTRKCVYSESFYSNNYKICLSLGANFMKGDDINIYCNIMRGDNDDRVSWPMKHRVTISIINQDTMVAHRSVTLQYDTYRHDRSAFDRPKKEINDNCIIVYSFITYSSIKDDPSVMLDDSIIVSCVLSGQH